MEGLRELVAAEGMLYTDGYIFGEKIYLGINDTPANYWEITKEEYENILREQEAECFVLFE